MFIDFLVKKIFISFLIILGLTPIANSQSTMIVQKQEILQVLDKFLYLSRLPEHFYGAGYVVKLIKEPSFNSYSVAITTPTYMEDLKVKNLYCLLLANKCFFVMPNNEIAIDISEFDSSILYQDNIEVMRMAKTVVITEGAVLAFPTIMLFRVNKENHLFHTRKVQFETYHPIDKLVKKYWPIENPVGVITNELIPKYLDGLGKPNKRYYAYIENGKGKFKIKTR